MSYIHIRLNINFNDISSIGMRKRYINIPLPDELARQIDRVITTADLGYKTKSEFIKEAVREKLIELGNFKGFKRNKKKG